MQYSCNIKAINYSCKACPYKIDYQQSEISCWHRLRQKAAYNDQLPSPLLVPVVYREGKKKETGPGILLCYTSRDWGDCEP